MLAVGANVGQYAQPIRGNSYFRELAYVESVTELIARIKELAAWNRGWTIHNLALDPTDRQAHINVTKTTGLSSRLAASHLWAEMPRKRIRGCRRKAMTVRGLDSLTMGTIANWSSHSIRLKIDSQGSARKMLGDSVAILGEVRTIQVTLPFRNIYPKA